MRLGYARSMENHILTRDQCRVIDRVAIEEFGISGLVLMENAGRGCVDVLERLGIDGAVAIVCGKGNNAGDGFVIARHLEIRGHACHVFLLSPRDELRGDAATNFAILQKSGVPIAEFAAPLIGPSSTSTDLQVQLNHYAGKAAWLV